MWMYKNDFIVNGILGAGKTTIGKN